MFGKLFDYAKQLLNDDDAPRDEGRGQTQTQAQGQTQARPAAPTRQQPLQQSLLSRSTAGEANFNSPSNPQQLWNREDLHLVLSEKKIEKCYDEKFRRGLVKFGQPVRYREPNIEVLNEFQLEMRDMYLILISQKKNQQNFNEEMKKLSEEFERTLLPMMTKYKDSTAGALIAADVFRLLPFSFKTRNTEKLSDLTYQFYTYDKLIVLKMCENRLQDTKSFQHASRRFDMLHTESEGYHGKVVRLRQSIAKIKQTTKFVKEALIGKFNKKMKMQKVLYILDKIQKKYQKVIGYCAKDLADTSLLHYPQLYQIFVFAMVNFKADAQKYSSLKLLRRLEEAIGKRLTMIKKRLKSETYSELKTLATNPKLRRTEKLGMLVDLHKQIGTLSKDIMNKCRVDGKLPKGLELFDDSTLLETHYNEIIAYNPSLDNERTKELIFGSGSSGDSRMSLMTATPSSRKQ